LQRAKFSNADLSDVDFTKAELGRSLFDSAVLSGNRFKLASLARADFRRAAVYGAIDFEDAYFFLTRIGGVNPSSATSFEAISSRQGPR
jgi:uncharacterized protein YjbI with pentapeptide repeats